MVILTVVSQTLYMMIYGIGYIFEELVVGQMRGLLPMFAVGIAVSALMLGVKAIRSFTWGA